MYYNICLSNYIKMEINRKMKIKYWSDFACPYCYIGNTRLKKAIKDLNLEDEIEIEVHAFELDPNAPYDVKSTTVERFATKYGLSVSQAEQEVNNISQLGIEECIDFKYVTTLYTNSRDAHRLMKYVQSLDNPELVEKLSKLLFDAYFTKNLKLADKKTLYSVAEEAGLDKKEVMEVLDSDLFNKEVQEDEQEALTKGIHAVPFYIIDNEYSIPGALSYNDFKNILSQVSQQDNVTQEDKTQNCSNGTCRI